MRIITLHRIIITLYYCLSIVHPINPFLFLSFCMRPSLYIQSSLCMCVQISAHSSSLHLTLRALKAGPPMHSCWRGCVQAECSRETTTTHIKGVPVVEHDYQPLSFESTSPPFASASFTDMRREETMICSIQADHRLILYSSPPFVCLHFLAISCYLFNFGLFP